MAIHKCSLCRWLHSFPDSNRSIIDMCVFAQSDYYLQEVDFDGEDCELDDFGEELWQKEHDTEESCATCIHGGTPSYKSPCSECANMSKYEKGVE